jgi:hypothetical protein
MNLSLKWLSRDGKLLLTARILRTLGSGLGNVFLPTEIEACCYEHAVPQVNYSCSISMGIDPVSFYCNNINLFY